MNGYTWQKIWGPTGQVLVRGGGLSGLFATEGPGLDPTGDIYAGGDTGAGMEWVKVGGPGKMFAVGPTDAEQPNLVGLSPDGGRVNLLSYEATPPGLTARWEQIGGPAGAIYAGEAGIFASNPDSGDLYAYDGTPMSWTRIGGPGKTFAVAGQLYGLSPDGSGVWAYSGTPMQWSQIGGPAGAIYAGQVRLALAGGPLAETVCATNPTTGDLYAYNGTPMSWTRIGGPGKTFTVADTICGLSLDSSGVWAYSGTPMQWSQIGGPAQRIATGPDQVCAVEPGTHHLLYAVAAGAPAGITPIQLPVIQ